MISCYGDAHSLLFTLPSSNDTLEKTRIAQKKKKKEEDRVPGYQYHRAAAKTPPANRRSLSAVRKKSNLGQGHSSRYEISSASPIIMLKLSEELRCIKDVYDECWVQEGLGRSISTPEDEEEEEDDDDHICAGKKEKETTRVKGIFNIVEQENGEKDLFCIHIKSNNQTVGHDTDFSRSIVALLKVCSKKKDLQRGCKIHADVVKLGLLDKNIYLGNALVSMYARCGSLAKAQDLCDKLLVRDIVSWNALIAGYVQHGQPEQAFKCFEQMQHDGLCPSRVTFVCILKACSSAGATERGKQIHAEIIREGFLYEDIIVGTALVDMYAKCGLLGEAQQIFEKLPARNVVSWTALIAGYTQHGCGELALSCFEKMQFEGLSPNAFTFACILKACGSIGAIEKGQEIHAEIARDSFLEKNVFVGTALVDMYAKCGLLAKAEGVFNKLPVRNVVSWSVLITGYAQHGCCEQAVNCLKRMRSEGLSPDAATYACMLKACGSIGAVDKGQDIHTEIIRERLLEKDVVVGTALVDMYAKCGLLAKAQGVFDILPVRNVVTWSALIAGYVQHGQGEQALMCFERMQNEGVAPNAVTFVCVMKACGCTGAADKGQEIHANIVREGLLEKSIVAANALIDMYAKCGLLARAQEVFDNLLDRDVVSWSSLIAGYARYEHGEQALNLFEQMQLEGLSPNSVTFACALKACASIGAVDKGQEIHAQIVREDVLEKDAFVVTALVDMYAKCGLLAKAEVVFYKLSVRDVVLWSALIAGYADQGDGDQALNCFEQMYIDGLVPNAFTLSCILKVCGSIGATNKGQEIHAEIIRGGFLEKDIVIGSALVDMYCKCGLLVKAQAIFDRLSVQDTVLWNTLVAGYAQHGDGQQAVKCFECMQLEGFFPDAVTFTCLLKACGNTGAAEKGKEIHVEIVRKGLLEIDFVVGTALVDMYVRCGLLAEAQEVFDKLPVQDVVSWNALLTGYALLGKAQHVFDLFDEMIEGVGPDFVTFTIVLNACSNAGLVDKGQMYYETMTVAYGIAPTLEHHSCMVDLFARVGHLDKALRTIMEMPFSATLKMWHAVLGACQKWGNLKLARLAFEHAVRLDETDAAVYVCMSNIYIDAGRLEDAGKVEAMRVKNEAWQKPGYASRDV